MVSTGVSKTSSLGSSPSTPASRLKFRMEKKIKNNHSKRVAMFSVQSDPLAKMGSHDNGGQNIYVHELSRWLSKRHWQVDIFTRLSRKRKNRIQKINRRVNVIYLKAGEQEYFPEEKMRDHFVEFFTNFLLYKQKNTIHYDIIHGHYWNGGWVAMHAGAILDIPFVNTFHSLGYARYNTLKKFQDLPSSGEQKEFERRFNLEKTIIKRATNIIAESPYEEDDLVSYYNAPHKKISINPAGVDVERFNPKDKAKARERLHLDKNIKVILYVGRLDWRKGVGTLIVAIKNIIKKYPRKRLLLLIVGGSFKRGGDDEDRQKYNRLKTIAEKNHIADMVRFEGSIVQAKLPYYYATADIVVVPSYYEPFGIVPLEAMACKVPVVASNTGGLQYTVLNSETGLLATPRDPFDLAEKITIMLKENELRKSIIDNAYHRVTKDFNWQLLTKNMDSLYSSTIKEYKKISK